MDSSATPEPQPAEPKPKLRWYQYSLRTLLIVTAILAAILGPCCWEVRRIVRRGQEDEEAYRKAVLADPDDKPSYEAFTSAHVFPYFATPTRKNQIKSNYSQLRVGLGKDDVARILGEPDCSQRLASKEHQEYRGAAWTYYLEKPDPNLVNLKNDKTVEVFFDPNGKVHWVVSNVEGLPEIRKPGL